MRNTASNVLSATNTASHNGAIIDGSQIGMASFFFYFGDSTAVGTVSVQVSNDPPLNGYQITTDFTPTNWINYAAPSAVTAGASALITVPVGCYRWYRAVFTYTSGGSSTVNCNMTATYL